MKLVRLAYIDQRVSPRDRRVALFQRRFVNPGSGFSQKVMACFHRRESIVFSINIVRNQKVTPPG